jgi:ABC-type Fe3+ transport system permease subunit
MPPVRLPARTGTVAALCGIAIALCGGAAYAGWVVWSEAHGYRGVDIHLLRPSARIAVGVAVGVWVIAIIFIRLVHRRKKPGRPV